MQNFLEELERLWRDPVANAVGWYPLDFCSVIWRWTINIECISHLDLDDQAPTFCTIHGHSRPNCPTTSAIFTILLGSINSFHCIPRWWAHVKTSRNNYHINQAPAPSSSNWKWTSASKPRIWVSQRWIGRQELWFLCYSAYSLFFECFNGSVVQGKEGTCRRIKGLRSRFL